jgi:FtsH-binding integral membrane protein
MFPAFGLAVTLVLLILVFVGLFLYDTWKMRRR